MIFRKLVFVFLSLFFTYNASAQNVQPPAWWNNRIMYHLEGSYYVAVPDPCIRSGDLNVKMTKQTPYVVSPIHCDGQKKDVNLVLRQESMISTEVTAVLVQEEESGFNLLGEMKIQLSSLYYFGSQGEVVVAYPDPTKGRFFLSGGKLSFTAEAYRIYYKVHGFIRQEYIRQLLES